MATKIQFPSWPSFTQEEADKVAEVLLSNKVNYWTGEEGRLFEKEFATFADSTHAIALANGTVALDLALYALGVGARNGGLAQDEVVVTSRTFMASVSSIVFAGAKPVFADVDVDSQNITPHTIEAVITPHTKAIIAVHLAGWPCDMKGIMALAAKHQLKVIEDCAQAHGAKINKQSVGSFGDVSAWSFCQDKIMTTGGEGGMVTTNDESLWKKMWAFKDHGKSYDAVYNTQHPPGFRWLHESFGTNWRLTEMQSAIGRIQLRRMPEWKSKRQKHSALINQAVTDIACIRIPQLPTSVEHACYKHYLFVEPQLLAEGYSRDSIIDAITAQGVPCMQGSCSEVYLEKAFEDTDFRPKTRLPIAKKLGETSLMFLVHPTISEEAMASAVQIIVEVLRKASK
jgi:dTDP-4-amino-4,6-dideoxygalactose transaminase